MIKKYLTLCSNLSVSPGVAETSWLVCWTNLASRAWCWLGDWCFPICETGRVCLVRDHYVRQDLRAQISTCFHQNICRMIPTVGCIALSSSLGRPGVVEIENLIVESFSNVRTGVRPYPATVMLTLTKDKRFWIRRSAGLPWTDYFNDSWSSNIFKRK